MSNSTREVVERRWECKGIIFLEVRLPQAFSITPPPRLRYQSKCGLVLFSELKVFHESCGLFNPLDGAFHRSLILSIKYMQLDRYSFTFRILGFP